MSQFVCELVNRFCQKRIEVLGESCQQIIRQQMADKAFELQYEKFETLKNCGIVYETPVFLRYLEKKKNGSVHHVIAYGIFCSSIGISLEDCLEHFLYAQTSAI